MLAKAARRPLGKENEALRARLEDLEETLRAIRSGDVDALVVETNGGEQIFTLKSADQTYRWMVEEMQKGAATLSDDGAVLYCNPFLAELLDVPVEAVLGAQLSSLLDEQSAVSMGRLLQSAEHGVSRGEVSFRRGGGSVPTEVSLTLLPLMGAPVVCMIVTDLTERKRREQERAQLEGERIARAAAELGIDLAQSWMIGDGQVDVLAGRAAGCRTMLVMRGTPPVGSRKRVVGKLRTRKRSATGRPASPSAS